LIILREKRTIANEKITTITLNMVNSLMICIFKPRYDALYLGFCTGREVPYFLIDITVSELKIKFCRSFETKG
jgi:hypothetical protein